MQVQRRGPGPQADSQDTTVQASAAAFAWQAAATGLAMMILSVGDDSYGVGYGGGLAAVGLLCMCGIGPLVLAVAGWAHAGAYTLPATLAAHAAVRRWAGPEWVWTAGSLAALASVYAAGAALLFDVSYAPAWLWIAASGVLPALSAAYWRRRSASSAKPKIWRRTSVAGAGLAGATLVLGVTALLTGVITEYEPPNLTERQLTGVWQGRYDGAAVRLHPDGRAVLDSVPYEGENYRFTDDALSRCTGTGTWHRVVAPSAGERAVVRIDVGSCARLTDWTIGGTEDDPELFALFGDPDSGDLHILDKE
ncbi:hypothetical protein [Streptomyces sp. NPDC002187]|uniref:hypothetical protein n=1 Tax=Streptomyces sp. NPDC002187 TaxID=3364637 RepID=UPI00368FFEF7